MYTDSLSLSAFSSENVQVLNCELYVLWFQDDGADEIKEAPKPAAEEPKQWSSFFTADYGFASPLYVFNRRR